MTKTIHKFYAKDAKTRNEKLTVKLAVTLTETLSLFGHRNGFHDMSCENENGNIMICGIFTFFAATFKVLYAAQRDDKKKEFKELLQAMFDEKMGELDKCG